MKYLEKISLILTLTILLGFGFSSCKTDEPAAVFPKTLAQYVKEFSDFYKSERLFVDSCKVGYNKGDFAQVSSSSFAKYKGYYLTVLKLDSAVIYNPNATIPQLVAANLALNADTLPKTLLNAGKNFWGKINIADKRELNDSIVSATKLNSTIPVGSVSGNVLQDAKTAFANAIAAATVTRDAATTIDSQAKAAISTLNAARIAFIAAMIPTSIDSYVQNSINYISAQLSIVQNCKVGYNINEYLPTRQTNYLNALLAAQTTANITGVTFNQLSTSMNSLAAPRNAFIPNVSDRRTLNDSIVAAQALITATVVGTNSGQVPQAASTTFTNVVNTAVLARDNPATIDGTVKATTYNLSLAKITFLNAIIK